MTNMDEREDFERNNSYNATYKCSMINSYQIDTFFTPNQTSKRLKCSTDLNDSGRRKLQFKQTAQKNKDQPVIAEEDT